MYCKYEENLEMMNNEATLRTTNTKSGPHMFNNFLAGLACMDLYGLPQ